MNKSIMEIMLYQPMLINCLMLTIMSISHKYQKFHPLSLVFILMFMILLICLKFNFLSYGLLPYFMFLMMIGGLMIIYMYISSLSNNNFFNLDISILNLNMNKIYVIVLYIMFMYYNFKFFNTSETFLLMEESMFKGSLLMNSLYQKINNKALYFLMLYLYFTMICIMNMCYKYKLPLRQLN